MWCYTAWTASSEYRSPHLYDVEYQVPLEVQCGIKEELTRTNTTKNNKTTVQDKKMNDKKYLES